MTSATSYWKLRDRAVNQSNQDCLSDSFVSRPWRLAEDSARVTLIPGQVRYVNEKYKPQLPTVKIGNIYIQKKDTYRPFKVSLKPLWEERNLSKIYLAKIRDTNILS